jgi:hypothetical protein
MADVRNRETVQIDQRGRSYLARLGYSKGVTLVADPVDGENDAWIIRPGQVLSELEVALLSNPRNVESLRRAAAESQAGESGTDLV